MDKIENILKEILRFFKNYVNSYQAILTEPYNFFKVLIEDNKEENPHYLNPYIFLLISTFLLIFAVNIFPILSNFLTLYPYRFSTLLLTFLEMDAKKVIIITLPTALLIYSYNKFISFFINRYDFKHCYSSLISYLIGSLYLTYFVCFFLLIVFSKSYQFINSFPIEIINELDKKYVTRIIWHFLLIFASFAIFYPIYSFFKIIRTKTSKLKIPFLTTVSLLFLITLTVVIAIKQKDYDKIFDPLKSYEVSFTFPELQNKSAIYFRNISRDDMGGGYTKSKSGKNDTLVFIDSSKNEDIYSGMNCLYLNVILTNNSPEILILNPLHLSDLVITNSKGLDTLVIFPLKYEELDVSNNVLIDSLKKTSIQDRIIFFPGETQWFHLSCKLDTTYLSKLSYYYFIENDSSFKNLKCRIIINNQQSSMDNPERPINTTSRLKALVINGFRGNRERAEQYEKYLKSIDNLY